MRAAPDITFSPALQVPTRDLVYASGPSPRVFHGYARLQPRLIVTFDFV
jgi:hypothetical protein